MKPLNGFNQRLLTTVILLPIVVLMIYRYELRWAFTLSIIVLAGIGLYEFYALVRGAGYSPETIGGIVAGMAVVFTAQFKEPFLTMFTLYAGCLMVATLHIARGKISLAGLAASVFGIIYAGWFPAHFILLHKQPHTGPGYVIMLLISVSLTDVAAYLVGSMIGRHKLVPKVSPKKTVEGSLGGLAATLIGMWVFYTLRQNGTSLFPDWTLTRYLLIGAVLSVSAQIGDLTESCLKRSANVKDSGTLFPGHGGVLDRCDGYLFAGPILYYIVAPIMIHGAH